VDGLAGGVGEVDEKVGALGGGEDEGFDVGGGGEQALVGADLHQWLLIREREDEEAAVGGVEDAEAVEARLDLEEGADLAVDEDAVGGELGDPGVVGVAGGRVEELAVSGEVAIAKNEGDFVFALGEMEAVFDMVADEEHAEEAGVGAEAIEAHGVVVVPEGGGLLLEGVGAGARLAGGEPVFWVAVVGRRDLGAVEVGDGADVGDVGAAAVEGVVDGEEVCCGKVVDPGDLEVFAATGFDEWSEGRGAVAPHACGRDVAMDLGMNLLHRDAEGALAVVECGTRSFGEWQGIDEGRELQRVEHGSRLAGCVRPRRLHGIHRHLGEGALCAVEQAECGGLLQKGAS
jgi:hypothetical protein